MQAPQPVGTLRSKGKPTASNVVLGDGGLGLADDFAEAPGAPFSARRIGTQMGLTEPELLGRLTIDARWPHNAIVG